MTNYKLLLLLGFIFLFVPFLGIPELISDWIIASASFILITYAFYSRSFAKKNNYNQDESVYIDSKKEQNNLDKVENFKRQDFNVTGESNKIEENNDQKNHE